MHDDVFVICVSKDSAHIKDSILTHCSKCNAEVWCSITNADKKALCLTCGLKAAEQDEAEIGVTEETLEEVARELKKERDSNEE